MDIKNTSRPEASSLHAHRYRISGQVQGVGFRPYIYRLAHHCHLVGWVKNRVGHVEIHVQGPADALKTFADTLIAQAPPLAHPHLETCISCTPEPLTTFQILPSETDAPACIHVPPDYFTCPDCLRELHDPNDRRYRYPFINCTQCGPRYTLIQRLPYDRPNTSMADFPLCPACQAEYHTPADRRFHAQPIACPVCGPHLQFHDSQGTIDDTPLALAKTVHALRAGKIIAVKGIGGYHLLCAATEDAAILRLRQQKPRPAKPLAVMFPLDRAQLNAQLTLTDVEIDFLFKPLRPILLVRKSPTFSLSAQLAPQLAELGVMLPYSPLHHLLLDDFGAPLVATSANLRGEPVLTANETVEQRLSHVADAFLHHNRPIVRPADDPVFRTIAKQPRPMRLGRGIAPLELTLPNTLVQPLLAVGGHLKNTVALAWDKRVVVSPHIGDLEAPRSLEVFIQVINDLQKLYAVPAQQVVCDAHPHYTSRRWAKQCGLPVRQVFHHHAHAAAVAGEFPSPLPWLVFTWDGVGFGADGTLWGGEALYGRPGQWHRVAQFRPFFLPGGEKAGRDLWRSALALCWESDFQNYQPPLNAESLAMLKQAWQNRLNCPQTTAVGRLFDAATALTGLLQNASFEGQGPMALEARCADSTTVLELPLEKNPAGVWQTDWAPLLPYLTDSQLPLAERASGFHNSLAHALVAQVERINADYPIGQIGLSGGVFQNRRLTEHVSQLLQQKGFQVYFPQRLPCNDAALSFGQIIEVCQQS